MTDPRPGPPGTRPPPQQKSFFGAGCMTNIGIILIVGGAVALGFASSFDQPIYFYIIGGGLLSLGIIVLLVVVPACMKKTRANAPPGVVRVVSVDDGNHRNGPPPVGSLEYIAHQNRLDLPPSYRSSQMFLAIVDETEGERPDGETEREDVPQSPPPTYGDVFDNRATSSINQAAPGVDPVTAADDQAPDSASNVTSLPPPEYKEQDDHGDDANE